MERLLVGKVKLRVWRILKVTKSQSYLKYKKRMSQSETRFSQLHILKKNADSLDSSRLTILCSYFFYLFIDSLVNNSFAN